MVIKCQPARGGSNRNVEIVIKAQYEITNRNMTYMQISASVDPETSLRALRLHDELFTFIPLSRGGDNEAKLTASSIQMQQNWKGAHIGDCSIEFLPGRLTPTLAFTTGTAMIQLAVSVIGGAAKSVAPMPDSLQTNAKLFLVLPGPIDAFIIFPRLGLITLYAGSVKIQAEPNSISETTTIKCYTRVGDDSYKYLLADSSGRLHMLLALFA